METVTPTPAPERARHWQRRVVVALLLVVLGWAGWYFGVELPERRAAAELAKLRAANARTVPGLGLDLVWIAPGEFLMGREEQNLLAKWFSTLPKRLGMENLEVTPERVGWLDGVQRKVRLTQVFWMGRTEVTQVQWIAVMGSNPSHFKGADLPVEQVSWNDAMEFCRRLTERERAAVRLPAGYEFTLPTEAQWEYACRAGTTGDYAGSLGAMAWYWGNNGGTTTTHPVGTKQANAWGLADMHGNVWEWCRDWYEVYPGGSATNPSGPSAGSGRISRGGSWAFRAEFARASLRRADDPSYSYRILGFRVALTPSRK